jgi:hypothetical protein
MKTSLIITMYIGLSILGCATRPMVSVTIFAIQGRVFDQESNFPLEKVDVYFIDTGYDDNRSRNPTPIKVAQSDSKGKIEARLNYLWSRKKSAFNNLPRATFDVVLSRDLYQTKRFQFEESELQTDRVAFLVNLEDVYMVRELK